MDDGMKLRQGPPPGLVLSSHIYLISSHRVRSPVSDNTGAAEEMGSSSDV